jgi:hypothetical protein
MPHDISASGIIVATRASTFRYLPTYHMVVYPSSIDQFPALPLVPTRLPTEYMPFRVA